jgi:hypothetical protein
MFWSIGVAYFQFCSNKLRCSDCLRASAECGWCEEAKFVDNVRCDVNFGDLCQGSIVKPEKRTTVTEVGVGWFVVKFITVLNLGCCFL